MRQTLHILNKSCTPLAKNVSAFSTARPCATSTGLSKLGQVGF